MKELLLKQMDFYFWANTKLLNTLKLSNKLPERALLLFSHIISVNTIWLNRLKGEATNTLLFQERTLIEFENLLLENHKNWTYFLQNIRDLELEKAIEFHFPIDNTHRTILKSDTIFQITNHSSYHRGQIVTLIKGSVDVLPHLGFVFFTSQVKE